MRDRFTLHAAAIAIRDVMIELGITIDGGKDSRTTAAQCPAEDGGIEAVRAPRTLAVSDYCTVEDICIK